MRYNPALDGLRAIAVLAVVAYHAGLPVPAGFVGVDIFFVISGYLITRLLHDEVQATGRIDFMGFYARRARRILPALAVVVLATLGLSVLLLPDASDVARSAAAAGAFVANLFFAAQTGDYWAASSDTMPLLHLWSLSVEEQFYLVWPVVLILARRKPVAALATLAVVSLALAEWWLWRTPTTAFYAMPARAWELALGGLVALRPVNVPKGSAWIGLAVVLLACFVPFAHFPGIGALPAVAGSALLIAAIQNGEAPGPLTLRPVVFVGLISYSLYLWHWPLLALDRALRVGDAPLAVRLALCGAAFVLACASYRYVETPFRRARVSNRRAVGVAVGCLAILSCGAWAMAPAKVAAPVFVPRCHPYYVEGQPVEMQNPACPAPADKVVLWGDSMAHTWTPLAEGLATRQKMPAVAFSKDGCPPFYGAPITLRDPKQTRDCVTRNNALIAYIRQNKADTVILAGHWQIYADAPQEMVAAVEALAPNVRRILVIGPTPHMRDDVPKCLALGKSCAVTRAEHEAESAKAWAMVRMMARQPKVEVIDPASWLCDATTCPDMRDGVPLYNDAYHPARAPVLAYTERWLTPTD